MQELAHFVTSLLLGDSKDELFYKHGNNRAPLIDCQIHAQDDIAAVNTWLQEYQHQPTTYRAYQKEAERLLLWCVVTAQKPLSALTREDFDAYITFLGDPQPAHIWCAPRGGRHAKRGTPQWRPFVGPLNMVARNMAITVLNSLMNYLVQARYLKANPLVLMKNRKKAALHEHMRQIQTVGRILEDEEWNIFLDTLNALPQQTQHEKDEKERLRYLVAILFLLGLRIHELEKHSWNAFRFIQGKWWFFVVGKGGKVGKIPVNTDLLEATKRFRQHIRLGELPNPDEQRPIIPSWRGGEALSSRQMHRLLKMLACRAALNPSLASHQAEKLRRFSPHWLRHLSASMQDRAGIRFTHIKENHRHAKDETTRIYVHAQDEERHEDMQKLKWLTS